MTVGLLTVHALLAPARASAGERDLALGRLRIPASDAPGSACPVTELDPETGRPRLPRAYCPDGEAWSRLVGALAAVVAGVPVSGAATGGMLGFEASLTLGITPIDAQASYWQRGTAGSAPADPDAVAGSVPGALLSPRLAFRKGLPFGWALAVDFGPLPRSAAWVWGAAVQWAPFEGFRTGWGALPDLAIRAGVHAMTGEPGLTLFVPEVGLVASKAYALGGAWTVEPVVGLDVAFPRARSGRVDLTPDVDGYAECVPDPASPALDCTIDPERVPDGRAPGEDLRNVAEFPDFDATRLRVAAGVGARVDVLDVRALVSFDLVPPRGEGVPADVDRQVTVTVAAGVRF